ncbi:MAG: hypothetical protein K0S37_4299 [Microbacterium sp.]|nr:hypothetical protein [Microbacterium sp.]
MWHKWQVGISGDDADERTSGEDSFDRIAADLQALRDEAGPVSYAELVRLITELRLDRGMSPAAAAPARSTVYNVFQPGRARMDPLLVRDIVCALGADDDAADGWVRRCRSARRIAEASARSRGSGPPRVVAPALTAPAPVRAWHPVSVAALLVSCVAVNLLGLFTVHVFKLSVYLDMVGTAVAALVLGPWSGVTVAVASNGLGFLTGDPSTIPFTPVNVVGALVWGYGIRRLRLGARLTGFVTLNLAAALACSLVATPIVIAVFHGGEGHTSELAVLSLEATRLPFIVSVFSANIVTSVTDKLLTGFIALGVFAVLHSRWAVSAAHMPLVERLAPRAEGRPQQLAG